MERQWLNGGWIGNAVLLSIVRKVDDDVVDDAVDVSVWEKDDVAAKDDISINDI